MIPRDLLTREGRARASRLLLKALVRAGVVALAGAALVAACRSSLRSPPPTTLLRDREGRFLAELSTGAADGAPEGARDGELGFWPVRSVPPRVAAATVAIEDRRFRGHPGVDPLSIARALAQNVRHRERVSGASTLAMQVARMQTPGGRSYARKLVEALTALALTLRNGREAVLAHYLTIVPYGNRIHGIEYAARRYLDKPVEDLSWAEVAFLTAIPQAPGRMNPFEPEGRRRAAERGRRILRLLRREGHLSKAELSLALREISRLRVPDPGARPDAAIHAILRIQTDLARAGAKPRVVTSTLDLSLQERVTDLAREVVAAREAQGAGNAAVAVVDRANGEVLAWVGSTGYGDVEHAGSIDYTRVPRSPGSALKPFLYALALERGVLTPASVLDDLDRGAGGITNADDLFLGPLLPRVALANSRNVPAADLLDRVGLEEGYAFLRDLGLHEGERPARHYGLGLSIGGLPVTLEELVRAYTVLSGDGRLMPLVFWRGQEAPAAARSAEPTPRPPGGAGGGAPTPNASARRLLSEDTARSVTLFLSDPMARLPSFPRMGATEYPFPVAVKTGTSSRYRDAWTVAYSTRYLVAAWVGHPDFRPMNRVTGGRAAADLVQKVMGTLHEREASGLADLSFPPPRGHRPHRLCALTGRGATEDCDRVFVEWLREGQGPVDDCRAHVRAAVDVRSGLLATRATPRRHVAVRTFVDLPPRYAAWAASAGLPRVPTAVQLAGLVVPVSRPLEGASGGEAGLALARAALAGPARPERIALASDAPARVRVTSPADGADLLRDPETPPGSATLALRAVVDPPAAQLVWYVDGRPFLTVDYPYAARWPIEAGEHTFTARLPFQAAGSPPVRVRVR